MGLELSTQEIAELETRTEGWIAGLQIAALAMRDRADVPGFIEGFAGSNRYVLDYLVEEVVDQQTEKVRSCLVQTSILSRMCAPLCDAVSRTPLWFRGSANRRVTYVSRDYRKALESL